MKISELFKNKALLNALSANPPSSRFSRKPMTLVAASLSLTWENCMEPDWWVGQQDGVYTRQDVRSIGADEIIAAAGRAGLDLDEVVMALAGWEVEREVARAEHAKAYEAGKEDRHQEMLAQVARWRGDLLAKNPWLADEDLAAAAERELGDLMVAHRHIDRMTRKLDLIDAAGNKLAKFSNLNGMKAWLFQHGQGGIGIDNRHDFVNALK